jgi:hypothetical protein
MNITGKVIGWVLGAMTVVIILTRLFNWIIYKLICRKRLKRQYAVICSSLVSITLILILIKKPIPVVGNYSSIYIYIFWLIFLLFFDLFLSPASKNKKISEEGYRDEAEEKMGKHG